MRLPGASSMVEPLLEVLEWGKQHNPYRLLKTRRLNFITIHYLYILSMTIIISILIFPAGELQYIDALFFASGCATQSGLNTVNLNDITTYQQIMIYLMTMFCTPIFIHSSVVFIRLYWFEKRFKHIVQESRNRLRSRSRTEGISERRIGSIEKSLQSRDFVVMHNKQPAIMQNPTEDSPATSDSGRDQREKHATMPFHRNITFADELEDPNNTGVVGTRLPQQLSIDQHIAIREKQRKMNDEVALHIPGPRDFDRGRVPEPLPSGDGSEADVPPAFIPGESHSGGQSGDNIRRNIRIDEPEHPIRSTHRASTFPTIVNQRNDLHSMATAPTEEILPTSARLRNRAGTFSSLLRRNSRDDEDIAPYLSWQPTIGRNSAFVDLSEQQREELGGIEYRSLKTLAVVLVSYYSLFHLLGVITLTPWIIRTSPWNSVVESDGVNKAWWGIFTSASLFNDLGYTLPPDSFQSFQLATLPLLLGSFLIVIGNTGFPCMLRLVIWAARKVSKKGSGVWEELCFLLDHPRRCFTLLFPAAATWWLFWILVVLNGLDIVFFIILDLKDPTVTSMNPSGYRVLNGLFQAASTRTAGFASVNLADLHPGIQVSYMIMMYISVFPIAISMRRTNVYEEKSLGIYSGSVGDAEDDKEPNYVGAHLRRQLSFDLWYIFLGLFIIAIAEGKHIENTNEYAFTLFSVLFEIVSAYGTVGLSLGYPNTDTSFSAQFSVVSKLVIIAMQIRGRHRGLPYELDRAVLLPSDKMHEKEDVDAARRVHRRNSSLSHLENPDSSNAHRLHGVTRADTARNMDHAGVAASSARDYDQ